MNEIRSREKLRESQISDKVLKALETCIDDAFDVSDLSVNADTHHLQSTIAGELFSQ